VLPKFEVLLANATSFGLDLCRIRTTKFASCFFLSAEVSKPTPPSRLSGMVTFTDWLPFGAFRAARCDSASWLRAAL
jgi:hypothetical protein